MELKRDDLILLTDGRLGIVTALRYEKEENKMLYRVNVERRGARSEARSEAEQWIELEQVRSILF